ncbi:hypothetical protein ABTI08_20800, partial [Acinetobacter baumannii]
ATSTPVGRRCVCLLWGGTPTTTRSASGTPGRAPSEQDQTVLCYRASCTVSYTVACSGENNI